MLCLALSVELFYSRIILFNLFNYCILFNTIQINHVQFLFFFLIAGSRQTQIMNLNSWTWVSEDAMPREQLVILELREDFLPLKAFQHFLLAEFKVRKTSSMHRRKKKKTTTRLYTLHILHKNKKTLHSRAHRLSCSLNLFHRGTKLELALLCTTFQVGQEITTILTLHYVSPETFGAS